jgi:hypothetical protein
MNNHESHAHLQEVHRLAQEKTDKANAARLKATDDAWKAGTPVAPEPDPGPRSRAAERQDPNAI